MTSIADFIKAPKNDVLSHLELGMRYSSYVLWAGFFIPGFPEPDNRCFSSVKLKEQIIEYTRLRINSKKDVQSLFALSIKEAIADNIETLEGVLNINLSEKCGSPSEFVETVQKSIEKYSDKIRVRPILGMDGGNRTHFFLTETFLECGLFDGLYVYGTEITENPEKFKRFFDFAKKYNLETKLHTDPLKNVDDFMQTMSLLMPSHIIHPDKIVNDKECLKVLVDNDVKTIVSPRPVITKGYDTLKKAQILRTLLDSGVNAYISTEDMLFNNQSISMFASDLCNTGLFTKDEMLQIIAKK